MRVISAQATKLDPGDTSVLRIDEKRVCEMLTRFIHDEVYTPGLSKAVLGLSGGLDSALVAALATKALGPTNIHAVFTPFRTSAASSLIDARAVATRLGIALEVREITTQIEAYFASEGGIDKVERLRVGNKCARERKAIEYDLSKLHQALVLGTSNKTELLLGYGTVYGDLGCALNPVGDLYKTQVRALARYLDVPESVITKAPSADLWVGQTDESELGLTYEQVDVLLYHLVDRRVRPDALITAGFDERTLNRVLQLIRRNHFKRVMPPIAKVSLRTVGQDFLYPRDWQA